MQVASGEGPLDVGRVDAQVGEVVVDCDALGGPAGRTFRAAG
jgi:hypothetical protein